MDPLLDQLAAAFHEHERAYSRLEALVEESLASDGRFESPELFRALEHERAARKRLERIRSRLAVVASRDARSVEKPDKPAKYPL